MKCHTTSPTATRRFCDLAPRPGGGEGGCGGGGKGGGVKREHATFVPRYQREVDSRYIKTVTTTKVIIIRAKKKEEDE